MRSTFTIMAEQHIALKDFIERILDERQQATHERDKVVDARLETLNHLRAEVMRDRELFVLKSYQEQAQNEVVRRLAVIEAAQSRMVGVGITLVLFAGIIGAVLGRVFK